MLYHLLINGVSISMCFASLLHRCLIKFVSIVMYIASLLHPFLIDFVSFVDQWCIHSHVHIPFFIQVRSIVYRFCIHIAFTMHPHCVWIASGPCKPDFANAADPILQRHFACKSVSAKGFPKQASPRFENRF